MLTIVFFSLAALGLCLALSVRLFDSKYHGKHIPELVSLGVVAMVVCFYISKIEGLTYYFVFAQLKPTVSAIVFSLTYGGSIYYLYRKDTDTFVRNLITICLLVDVVITMSVFESLILKTIV